jgi:hypothetical protein
MPLEHGKSKKAFEHNVKTEVKSGKPLKQSLAIAYSMKRKHKKMAHGGAPEQTHSGHQSPDAGIHQDQFHEIDPEMESMREHHGAHVKHNLPAMHEDARMLNQHGEIEEGPEGHVGAKEDAPHMADGGDVPDDRYHADLPPPQSLKEGWQNIKSELGTLFGGSPQDDQEKHAHGGSVHHKHHMAEGGEYSPKAEKFIGHRMHTFGKGEMHSHTKHGPEVTNPKQAVAIALHEAREKGMKVPHEKAYGGYAEGGPALTHSGYEGPEHEMDMVGRIMKKRQMEYSKGGQVANQEHGEHDNEMADFSPNEFDDLVLRDDDLESEYTGANSGDEDGNEYGSHHDDLVSRIMLKRKKQHNPNPA